jgi:hypothetical protein
VLYSVSNRCISDFVYKNKRAVLLLYRNRLVLPGAYFDGAGISPYSPGVSVADFIFHLSLFKASQESRKKDVSLVSVAGDFGSRHPSLFFVHDFQFFPALCGGGFQAWNVGKWFCLCWSTGAYVFSWLPDRSFRAGN